MTITDFVRTTSYQITPSHYRLPEFVWSLLMPLNQIHYVWRYYRRASLYSNPDNFAQLVGGYSVNVAFGESTLLKIAAQSLLIATRLLACAEQQASLYREGIRFITAIKGYYPYPAEVPWTSHLSIVLISPSSFYQWKMLGISTWHYISRIAVITARIFYKLFILNMYILDTIDAFYISPTTKNEAINEGCLNIIKWLNTVVNKKEDLLQGIVENKTLIEKILKGSPITYNKIHATVASALATTELFQHQINKVASFGNGIIAESGKRFIYGIMSIAGLSSY